MKKSIVAILALLTINLSSCGNKEIESSSVSPDKTTTTTSVTSTAVLETTVPTTTPASTTTTTTTSLTTTTTNTVTTTTPVTTTTEITTTYDYTPEILRLEQENNRLQSEIYSFQNEISNEESNIALCEVYKSYAEDCIEDAKRQLEEANNTMVRVYGPGGWSVQHDSDAIQAAQNYLDECQQTYDYYVTLINNSQSNINYYNECISNNQAIIDSNNNLIWEYQNL